MYGGSYVVNLFKQKFVPLFSLIMYLALGKTGKTNDKNSWKNYPYRWLFLKLSTDWWHLKHLRLWNKSFAALGFY